MPRRVPAWKKDRAVVLSRLHPPPSREDLARRLGVDARTITRILVERARKEDRALLREAGRLDS